MQRTCCHFFQWGWTQGFVHLGKHWGAPQPCSYVLNNADALCSFQLVFAVETRSLGLTHTNLKQEPLWSEHLNTFFHVLHRCYSFSIFHFLGGFWWLWVSLKSIHFNTIAKPVMRHKASLFSFSNTFSLTSISLPSVQFYFSFLWSTWHQFIMKIFVKRYPIHFCNMKILPLIPF